MPANADKPLDPRNGIRAFLVLDGAVRLLIWIAATSGALATVAALDGWPKYALLTANFYEAWGWADKFMWCIVFFNIYYVTALVVLRAPIPRPAEGTYSLKPGVIPDRSLIYSMLIATLIKARYEPPFPGFLVHAIANLPPLCWLIGPVFGPRSRSVGVTDPLILDPHWVEIGRNVVIGYGAIISGHTQGRDDITIQRTIIGNNVLVGGNAVIYHGCRIGDGAVIMGSALLRPETIVGENEVWGGIPAKKIKTLPPYGAETRPGPDDAA